MEIPLPASGKMSSLQASHDRLARRLSTGVNRFQQLLSDPPNPKLRRWHEQEGLLSTTWQSWCSFCRSLLLESSLGTTTIAGAQVTSSYSGTPEPVIRYVAACVAKGGSPPKTLKPIPGMYAEPTWGSLKAINQIVAEIKPTNLATIMSAFGSASIINDLQVIRNASAHLNSENLASVTSLRVRYLDNAFVHPSDAIYWVDPTTKDFAFNVWVKEMTVVAKAAIQ